MKKIILSLVLVVALSFGCLSEVYAEGCVEHNWGNRTYISTVCWGYGSQMSHNKRVTYKETCLNEGCTATRNVEELSVENHDFYLYDNLGHQDGYHKYRIYCRQCNENFIVTLICDNRNGHSTPWSCPGEELLLK